MNRNTALEGMKKSQDGWSSAGTVLLFAGIAGCIFAVSLDPTIEVGSSIYTASVDRVVNLQGQAQQVMALLAGLAAALAGIICHGVSAIIRALRAMLAASSASE